MSRFDLLDNFVDNQETLIRKTKAKLRRNQSISSSSQLTNPPESNDQPVIQGLTPELDVIDDKSFCEFSAPTTANICIGPAVDINGSFELKHVLIDMVQASQFYGKAHKDASAHLQHFLEICSTFTIKDIPRDAIYFSSTHSHSWGEQSSGSMPTRRRILHGHFVPPIF